MLQKLNNILDKHKLRKTHFRLQVLELFVNNGSRALSQANIEEQLSEYDRITLYRTLKSFEKKGVIHKALDAGTEVKFALCHDDCDAHRHSDDHPHFLCVSCGHTYCLDELDIPQFNLPEHYILKDVQLALSGICDNCNNTQSL